MGASAGRVLLIPKGDWNVNTTYTGLDWVRHNGAAWVCKNTCTGIEPTEANADNWQMMARDGDGVTADTSMSDTSTNAVQNKVVKSYVDNSIAGISDMTGATADQNGTHGLVPAPQAGDEKKVLLGDGTWGAIDDKFSFSDHDTATSGTSFTDAEDGNMIVTDWTKNLLNPTLETVTENGVTCTRNVDANGKPDGTYTLNGTATDNFNLYLCEPEFTKLTKGEEYRAILYSNILNGLDFDITNNINEGHHSDEIYGYNFICNEDEYPYGCSILIRSGTVFNNILIKPMLTTDLNATYDDFVPYGGYEIKSCGKNLLDVSKLTNGKWLSPTDGSLIDGDYYYVSDFIPIKSGVHYVSSADVQIGYSYDESYYCIYDSDKNFVQSIKLNDHINFDSNINGYLRTMFNKSALDKNIQIEEGSTATDFEPYTGETITVTNDTESPAFGLKSHKDITNIISPGNVKCVYPTNESGKGVLDAMYNNELSKLKNAIFTYKTKDEYDAAVANDKIPDGATVIKDYDD